MTKISYHASVKDVQAKFAPGTAVNAAVATPFDRPEWLALLEKTGATPLYVTARNDRSEALLALTNRAGRIAPLKNWYAFTWRPLVSQDEWENELVYQIAADLKSRAHRVTLEPVPNEDGAALQLAQQFARAGWRVEVSQCDLNHFIEIGSRSFADYWAERPSPLRTTLKRKGRKVETRIETRFDASLWRHYEQIYAASWKPEEDYPDMLRAFAKIEGEQGRLRLGFAFLDGKPIAAQFWTVENETGYIHKLAHLEEYKNLSAGTTLSAAMFEHAINVDEVQTIDFGTGDQPYKADWMEETRPRYRIDCFDMKSPKAWLDLFKLAYNRTKSDGVPMLAPEPYDG